MPPFTGNYSRLRMDDESKRYPLTLLQMGVPMVDADYNSFQFSFFTFMRRFLQFSIGDGSPNDGFKIEESSSSNVNNFTVKGGDGTNEGAGRIFAGGFPGMLVDDVDYTDDSIDIHAIVVSRTDTVLTDTSSNWDVDELVGRELVPDIDNPGTTFTILSNTATSITVAGGLNLATSARKHYRINPSTPSGSNRTDEVYVDMWLDEISSVDDPNLKHPFVTPTEAMRRGIVRQVIKIKENGTTPADFVDADGNQHVTLHLATIDRLDGDATITNAMITDERTFVGDFATIKNEIANARNSPLLGVYGNLKARLDALEDIQVDSPLERSIDVGPAKIRLTIPAVTTSDPGHMTAADKAFLDQILSDDDPEPIGPTADEGTAGDAARRDHVHPIPFSATAPVQASGLTGDVGSSDELSRSDHLHPGANSDENIKVVPDSPSPGNTVTVQPGTYLKSDSTGSVVLSSPLTSPAFAAVSAQPRIDVLEIDDAGALSVITGVEAASPSPPSYSLDKLPLAEITIDEVAPASVVINAADIRDVRPLLGVSVQDQLGGDTNTVIASKGLTNIGNNIDANIRPLTGLGVIGLVGFNRDSSVIPISSGGSDPSTAALPAGTITVTNKADRIALIVYAQSFLAFEDTGAGADTIIYPEVLIGGVSGDIESNSWGFFQRLSIDETQVTKDGQTGASLSIITGSPAQNPGNVTWGNFVREGGTTGTAECSNRMLVVFEIIGS